jgi:hypothetical protein
MRKSAHPKTVLPVAIGISTVLFTIASQAQLQTTVAYDDANSSAYNSVSWPTANGGYGYNLWTALGGASGGGTYTENSGRQVDGSASFALYAGSGSYAISRPLTSPIAGVADFSILTRFDLGGTGPNLVNLRTGNNTSGFGSGELISFGIVNGNSLSYTDSTGFHLFSSGEARGGVWDWNVLMDTITGAYTLSVSEVGGGYSGTMNGTLESTGTSVGSFGVINSSTGNNQNLIFDAPEFSVPEPTSLALLGLGVASFWFVRRRR